MKILVVGGAGYVGGGIVDNLSQYYEVTVYDSLIYETSYRKKVNFILGDIRDTKKLNNILKDFDVVVWLAALVGDGACAINPDLTNEINSESVKNLVENFDKKIIFLSTCSVYGAQDGVLTESSPTNPLSEYASSKLKAEEYLKDSNSLIFRLGTLFGISDEFSRVRLDLVVNILTAKALIDKKISVFGGEQWRPLLHVNDVSNAISHCLKTDVSGIYNLHHKNYRIIDIAREIENKVKDVEVEVTPMSFEDARNYQVSSQKLFDETGFDASIELINGVNEIYDLIFDNRIKDITDPRYSNQNFLKKFGVS
ncbi:SDR family oxidoreductase [Candidatus Actinomarina sp. HD9-500m-PIT-SAG01]|nr:SDR family oxidoreductase [Candidatus Actinomarina sp. HD9-500m-PIT-SAG01]|tara:strand:- start:73 stop:1005 length:933 start_codon:yes stop_codon:yes gene_type:complete